MLFIANLSYESGAQYNPTYLYTSHYDAAPYQYVYGSVIRIISIVSIQ